MSIVLQGHKLNQRQLDAITPIMNDFMHGKIKGKKKLEQACAKALEAAGCALGYDTSMPGGDATVEQRAAAWMRDGDVGMSSRAIHDHMLGVPARDGYAAPADPDDLNRCIKLLELIPEWKPRMGEMAQRGEQWVGLAGNWGEICKCFLDEVGLDWCKGNRAPKTYLLMKQAMEERT
ncbi:MULTISPECIES: hypothetical protein [Pseudomonas]|uniref:hypothetical protein n=1 Tax=Pseudomonas TaxID=286 RepID=UPI001E317906|nr:MULTISPECIES: hypothetical protein [Pseudomonas]MDM3891777.1 hypothetical protein [Pseudomonas juntendi]